MIIFTGCLNRIGHYNYIDGVKEYGSKIPGPWEHLDSEKIINSNNQGDAWVHYKDGWSALGICDLTVDSRPGSRAVFAINQPFLPADILLTAAKLHYEDVIDRVGPVKVVKTFIDGVEHE